MKSPHLLRASALAVVTAISLLGPVGIGVARAAAPMVKTSAPGYFRMMLGDFEVTALSDGTVDLPISRNLRANDKVYAWVPVHYNELP